MADYIPSNLVVGQAKLLENFASPEKRFKDPVVFKELLAGGQIMFPSHDVLRTREDRPINAYYKLRSSRALGTGRSHDHTGTKGDSGVLTPSWITYNDKFSISLKQGDNNVFGLQEQFDNEMENVVANFAEGFETQSTSYIHNNRTNVNIDASGEGAFNGGTFVYEIAEATEGDRAAQITNTMLENNKYSQSYTMFCDTRSYNQFQFQANQGGANATNLSFQFGGVKYVHAPELNALAVGLGYTKGYWVAIPVGTVSALPWIPRQNRAGVDTKVNKYSTLLNPVDSQSYAVHMYEERADDTARNGYTQDVVTEYEFSLDIAFEKAPLSTAGETTMFAVALT